MEVPRLHVIECGHGSPRCVELYRKLRNPAPTAPLRPLVPHTATMRAFRAAALAAGYEDHGGPGDRASTEVTQMRQRQG